MRELILEINDSHGRSISTLKPTVENKGNVIFSVENNVCLFKGRIAPLPHKSNPYLQSSLG